MAALCRQPAAVRAVLQTGSSPIWLEDQRPGPCDQSYVPCLGRVYAAHGVMHGSSAASPARGRWGSMFAAAPSVRCRRQHARLQSRANKAEVSWRISSARQCRRTTCRARYCTSSREVYACFPCCDVHDCCNANVMMTSTNVFATTRAVQGASARTETVLAPLMMFPMDCARAAVHGGIIDLRGPSRTDQVST